MLITEGAGFMGGNVAVALSQAHSDWQITAFHNLHRRGSELNLRRLREAGVSLVHGDVRTLDDLVDLPAHEAIAECSAEQSVLAGTEGSPGYVVQSNLVDAYHCLEYARRHLRYVSTRPSRCSPPLQPDREFPLKAVARGYDFDVVPISWTNRRYGASKLKIQEMGSRYAFIVLYVWLEQLLSRGDYRRKDLDGDALRVRGDRWVQTGSSPADQTPSQPGERRASRRLARH